MIDFIKHAYYKLDLIQTHVIFLHFGIKYYQNRSVIGPGAVYPSTTLPIGKTGRLFYVATHKCLKPLIFFDFHDS